MLVTGNKMMNKIERASHSASCLRLRTCQITRELGCGLCVSTAGRGKTGKENGEDTSDWSG